MCLDPAFPGCNPKNYESLIPSHLACFGTKRSLVRIQSPRPLNYSILFIFNHYKPELLKVLGSRVATKRIADAGEITPLGSGIYASPGLDPFIAAVIATARFYPKTVISNLTALVIHGLSDESVDRVDVDLERRRTIRNRLLRVHRVSKSRLTGITTMIFQGEKIRIYDRERTLCDAYKIDPSGSIFFKALKRYVKGDKVAADRIADYDRKLGTDVLRHLRQELADA